MNHPAMAPLPDGMMTEYHPFQRTSLRGFRLDQIALAFDRVRDHHDWKAPIRATIHLADQALVAEAIQWFTGTAAGFSTVAGSPELLLVTAPGQRLGPLGHAKELPRGFARVASQSPRSVEQGAALDPQK